MGVSVCSESTVWPLTHFDKAETFIHILIIDIHLGQRIPKCIPQTPQSGDFKGKQLKLYSVNMKAENHLVQRKLLFIETERAAFLKLYMTSQLQK